MRQSQVPARFEPVVRHAALAKIAGAGASTAERATCLFQSRDIGDYGASSTLPYGSTLLQPCSPNNTEVLVFWSHGAEVEVVPVIPNRASTTDALHSPLRRGYVVRLLADCEPSDIDKTSNVLAEAVKLNAAQREQAVVALTKLNTALYPYRYKAQGLPEIETTWAEDGTLLIEWQVDNRRMGFSLEADAKESGWFFISAASPRPVRMAGNIETFNAADIVARLLAP